MGFYARRLQTATPYVQTQPFPTDGLGWSLPATLNDWADLKLDPTNGMPKVFAHHFGQLFPQSINNSSTEDSDYYVTHWCQPEGESSAYADYGGRFRNRPLWRSSKTGTNTEWATDDFLVDVQTAAARGIDGFTVDMISLSTSANNNRNIKWLMAAADLYGGNFKIVLMIDTSVSIGSATANDMATLLRFHCIGDDGQLRPYYGLHQTTTL